MSGYISRVMGTAISSLNAQQAIIASTSNNIANVNTPGYARRVLDLETRGGGAASGGVNIGNGVTVGNLQRVADSFLEEILRESEGDAASYQMQDEFLGRVEALFSFTGGANTIGSTMNDFFAAANDLSIHPSSMEFRANFVERAKDLVTSIKETYDTLASLQAEADQRIETEINTINSMTAQIASLNSRISTVETAGKIAADERDQRDQLVKKLSEKIEFDYLEASDGSVTLSLASGFPLVAGNISRDLETKTSPSFNTNTPPSLSGGALNYIVYDFSGGAGTADMDLTQEIAAGSGTLAGLLTIRGINTSDTNNAFQGSGVLIDLARQVEDLSMNLLQNVNETYFASDGSNPAVSLAYDMTATSPAVYGLFTAAGVADADADGLPNDLAAYDYDAAALPNGIKNFTSLLEVNTTIANDYTRLAAARVNAVGDTPSQGDGRNMKAIADLQTTTQNLALSGFSGTYSEAYDNLVSTVGNLKARANVNVTVSQANLEQAEARREEFSGVSLDEEFTNLIRYQRAFEASARIISIANELLQQVVSLI